MLLTGHPGVGKSTFAPVLASALGAVCLCKDEVRYRVFDGWQPVHPSTAGVDELRIGSSVLSEDSVVWRVFSWAVTSVAAAAPVVAETALVTPAVRASAEELVSSLPVPVVEVLLWAEVDALVARWRARAVAPDAHPVRARHRVGTEGPLLSQPYEALLPADRVVRVDATDPAAIDVGAVAERVRAMMGA